MKESKQICGALMGRQYFSENFGEINVQDPSTGEIVTIEVWDQLLEKIKLVYPRDFVNVEYYDYKWKNTGRLTKKAKTLIVNGTVVLNGVITNTDNSRDPRRGLYKKNKYICLKVDERPVVYLRVPDKRLHPYLIKGKKVKVQALLQNCTHQDGIALDLIWT